jgi:CRISPR/Cas system-associated protein Cas7 (RAMP superfamily)
MDYPHRLSFSDESKKNWTRVTALFGLDDWCAALGVAEKLMLKAAEKYVKGNDHILFVPEKFAKLYKDNQEFFEALCEEGVVEWLEPFVNAGKK